ncbi:MAG: carbamate kinase [Aeriscardovia sp.]|nr:carbamate kinase [Aeriscardovia sp.]
MGKRIVVALGGNAIETATGTAESQEESIKKAMQSLVEFVKNEDELVITHGNGPQVGNLLLQEAAGSTKKNPPMPLDTVGAMSEGEIGYWMELALESVLAENGISKTVGAIISQSVVSKDDPAFSKPTKPIGPFYSKEECEELKKEHPDFVYVEDAGRGYRRVVPSPKPMKMLQAGVVKAMIEKGMIPVASGGGGVPVVSDGKGGYIGVEGVIDKDFGAAQMAQDVDADELIILTAVDNVCINFNKPDQKALTTVTVEELEKYIAEGQFAAGSMLPKVQAAIKFVNAKPQCHAIIASLERTADLVAGVPGVGTIISK